MRTFNLASYRSRADRADDLAALLGFAPGTATPFDGNLSGIVGLIDDRVS